MKEVILIPSLDPDKTLVQVVSGLHDAGKKRILIIDDGSATERLHFFEAAERLGATVLHHKKNLGKGSAIKTGLQNVVDLFPDVSCVITADDDGQHSTEDICLVAEKTALAPDTLTIGARDLDKKSVPFKSRFGNKFSALYFRFLTGYPHQDTQSGLRGIPRQLFDFAAAIKGERYDYEMNFLIEAAQAKISIQSVPIHTIYVDNNKSSHFRAVRDSLLIFKKPLRFTLASVSSSIVDISLFTFLVFFTGHTGGNVMAETVVARCISGIYNFTVNKHWSFASSGDSRGEFFRYLLLFLLIMLLSGLSVSLLNKVLDHIFVSFIKIIVDSFLFLLSYKIQHSWVFRDR